ncbi:MAG: hypothetical protein WC500_03225 [Candidatus Margulisiibacteriota bacterium]
MKSRISASTNPASFFFNARDQRICRSGGGGSKPPLVKSPAAKIDTNQVLAEAKNTLKFYLILATDLETPPPHIIDSLNNCYEGLGLPDIFTVGWVVINATIRSGNLTRPLKAMGELGRKLPELPTSDQRDHHREKLIIAYLDCQWSALAGKLAREIEAPDRRFTVITKKIVPLVMYTDNDLSAFELLTTEATLLARMSPPALRIERFSIIAKLLAKVSAVQENIDLVLQELSGDLVGQNPSQEELDRLKGSIAKHWSAFPATSHADRLEKWLKK